MFQSATTPILTDLYPSLQKTIGKGNAGKLATLIGIKELWSPLSECSFESLQTKVDIQGVGDFPGEDIAAATVNNCHQVNKSFVQANVGDVSTPNLIGTLNGESPDQIGITRELSLGWESLVLG
jgi:hypothetical protein